MLKCLVCGRDTRHLYYGAIVCDPCRTFFRRYALNEKPKKCKYYGKCQVKTSKRKVCGRCRYIQCLAVGMKLERVVKERGSLLGGSVSQEQPEEAEQITTTSSVSSSQGNFDDDCEKQENEFGDDFPVKLHWMLTEPSAMDDLIIHDCIMVKRPPTSDIDVRVVDVSYVPYMYCKIRIQFHESEPIPRDKLLLPFGGLVYEESRDSLLIHNCYRYRKSYIQAYRLSSCVVAITRKDSIDDKRDTSIVMNGMTDENFDRMCLALKITQSLREVPILQPILEEDTPNEANDEVGKRSGCREVSFLLHLDMVLQRIAVALQLCIPFLQTLSEADKTLLFKEVTIEIVLLLCWFSLDNDSLTVPFLNRQLLFGVKLPECFLSNETTDNMWRSLTDKSWLNDRRSNDIIVKNLVILLCLFQDRPGLSCRESLEQERHHYHDLLDRYAEAKLRQEPEKGSLIDFWSIVDQKLTLVSDFREQLESLGLNSGEMHKM